MKKYPVNLLELGALTGTRAVAAAGLALLLARKIPRDARKPTAWALLGGGGALYVVLLADLLLKNRSRLD